MKQFKILLVLVAIACFSGGHFANGEPESPAIEIKSGAQLLRELGAIEKENDDYIKDQVKTLKQLDAIGEISRQLRIFAKKSTL